MPIIIEGNASLHGTVALSGAKNSALKLIIAAMYSNEDVILDNVPRLESVLLDLEIVRSIGGKVEWVGNNKLLLNGAGINTYEIPQETGSRHRTAFLLAGPLLYRFGKAVIPLAKGIPFKTSPINRIIDTWKSLGFELEQDSDYLRLSSGNPKPGDINFKTSSHTGTDNAIMSSIFIDGETTINNASEEPEIDDLIGFLQAIGVGIKRTEPRTIKIQGTHVYKGAIYTVMPDKFEAAVFATAAILTKGNIAITKINKFSLVPFINYLSKLGANYTLSDNELRVWSTGAALNAINTNISPSPGFVPDWQPLAVLLANIANGVSLIHDTVYTDRLEYIRDLNRMGAQIELVKPSSVDIVPVISDDSYDFEKLGEPLTVAKVVGPVELKGEKIHIIDPRFANVLVLSALMASGKTELHDYKALYEGSELFFDKLVNLGAKIRLEE